MRHRDRYCWRDHDATQPVTITGYPPIACDKNELRDLLPDREPCAWLDTHARIHGRRICPVPLAYHDRLFDLIETETDMTHGDGGWGLQPIGEPSSRWPAAYLKAFRAARAAKGKLQTDTMVIDE